MANYKQLIKPNLDDDPKHPLYVYQNGKLLTNWVGWCLAVAKAAFGATKSMGTALKAWNADPTKHTNYALPEGVYCLIWWNGYWQDGEELGHVAIAKRTGNKVKIWSSPYKKSYTFAIFEGDIEPTINGIAKTYKLNKYLGWTEMVCEKRVIEQIKGEKSNEEICAEVWEGKWGTGKDREKRLTEAGYDYATIQKMVDAGVGKPEPVKETKEEKKSEPQEAQKEDKPMTTPTINPEPTQNGSSEATEPISNDSVAPNQTNDLPISGDSPQTPEPEDKKLIETTDGAKTEFVPAQSQDMNAITDIIEEAGEGFNPPKTVKLIAYLVGDALLVGSLLTPDIVNMIQAPTPNIWAEYFSKVLLMAGVSVLVVFKLFKRKK